MCRCGPVEWPRLPTSAISSPAVTCSPIVTSERLTCPYVVTVPSSWRTRTHSPKPLAGPEATTSPASGARMGVPIGAAMSMPLWL